MEAVMGNGSATENAAFDLESESGCAANHKCSVSARNPGGGSVWVAGGLPRGTGEDELMDWKSWCMKVIKGGNKTEIARMAAITWGVWWERNDRVWNQKMKPIELIVRLARESVEDWVRAQQRSNFERQPRVARRCDKWHAPAPTFIKINCDAALFAEHHAFGIGLVARDEDGVLIGYRLKNRQGCPPAKECEAEAIVAGVEWAVEQGFPLVDTILGVVYGEAIFDDKSIIF
ncbi:hypothetical protein LINPERPRIM_LOCUS19493 [Linum perenne]